MAQSLYYAGKQTIFQPTAMTRPSERTRAQAVQDLLRIEIGGAYISKVRHSSHDAIVERQVTDLVAGVTRWRRYLDFLLGAYYTGNIHKVEPRLKQILRIAVFECYLAHKAPHAVVSSAVQLAKDMVRPGAGRLVNAILRNMQRAPLPEPATDDPVEDSATRYSHPTWMVRRWLDRLGPDATLALMKHNNSRPWYGIRCNTLQGPPQALQARLTALGVRWEPSAYLEDFVRATRIGPIRRARLFGEGRCAVQDEGAGLAVRLLDPQPGEYILDLCAAPGGKAMYAATRMQNRGALLAVDYHENRLRRVAEALSAHRITIIETRTEDARQLNVTPAARVLLDAPCTGTGVLAKRADLRWRRTLADLNSIVHIQDQLLDAAARCVHPGGILVYSTCSIEAEENEVRVEAFLRRHKTFVLEHATRFLPSDVVTKAGYLQTLPFVHMTDGTFAARMRRA